MLDFLFYQVGDKLPRDFEVGHLKISWLVIVSITIIVLGGMNEYYFCTNYNLCE
jgi:hypothetical protein